jgi:hypothetical protein
MFAWLGRRPRALSWLIVLAGFQAAAAAPPTEDELRAWIGDLTGDSFAAREIAAGKLASAGEPAAALLSECMARGDAESAWRAAAVLAAIRTPKAGPDDPPGPEPLTTVARFNDDSPAPTANPNPPPSPDPPPESSIADALAPPPEPLALEDITDQVHIADAYVSPELISDASPPTGHQRPIPSRPTVAQQPFERISPAVSSSRMAPSPRNVALRRSGQTLPQLATPRDNQPRLMNIFIRARSVLGLSTR